MTQDPFLGALVLEIGGTWMRAARYDPTSDCLSSVRRRLSPNFLNCPNGSHLVEQIMDSLADLAREVLVGKTATVVSLAFPAPIDPAGNALRVPTLLGPSVTSRLPVATIAAKFWPDARVFVLNDLTAAGYRYAAEEQDFCILTVGSGIGHKVFINGEPQVGASGGGGEIGHLRLDFGENALPCDCGGIGHLGGIASGRGAAKWAMRSAEADRVSFRRSLAGELACGDPSRLDPIILVEAFRSGDGWSRDVIRATANRLAQALAAIYLDVGIESFIIIGGFAIALGEDYRSMLAEGAGNCCWDIGQNWMAMIRLGTPGDEDALLGGGRYAMGRSGIRVAARSGPQGSGQW